MGTPTQHPRSSTSLSDTFTDSPPALLALETPRLPLPLYVYSLASHLSKYPHKCCCLNQTFLIFFVQIRTLNTLPLSLTLVWFTHWTDVRWVLTVDLLRLFYMMRMP